MQLEVTINGGIGDIIHSHAMLAEHRSRYSEIAVGLDRDSVAAARSPEYLPFADRLIESLFDEPPFVVRDLPGCGMTPQMLAAMGFPTVVPNVRKKLGLLGAASGRYVAVTTKIRGWPRFRYAEIRERFLEIVGDIASVMPVVLVGEREIGRNAEYEHHGDDYIYSIYGDLAALPVVDQTVPELGSTPPTWKQFLADCRTLAGADRVLTLGSGGNVTMAIACGRAIVLAGGTEMGSYFLSMPTDRRVTFCTNAESYLAAAGSIA